MKSIYQHYQEILQDESLRYYREQMWNEPLEIVLSSDGAKEFIRSIISAGKKNASQIFEMLEQIPPFRHNHIVSTYLLGIALYKDPFIKQCVDVQLSKFEIRDSNFTRLFLYVWFLICFFHDLGYAYELRKIKVPQNFTDPVIREEDSDRNMFPDIYTTKLVRNYQQYREQCMCTIDHGIYGGMAIYEYLVNKLQPEDNIKEVLRTISSIIMVHNIYFQNDNSLQAKCYRCCDLKELLYTDDSPCRKISLQEHPLLFLFDLVDSIEPMKCVRRVKLLDKIQIGFDNALNIEIPQSTTFDGMRNNVKGLNSWLTDVKEVPKGSSTYRITLNNCININREI